MLSEATDLQRMPFPLLSTQSSPVFTDQLLNVSNTKELITDFREKEAKTHTPVYSSGAEKKQVNSFRFLGINITENLSWSSPMSASYLENVVS